MTGYLFPDVREALFLLAPSLLSTHTSGAAVSAYKRLQPDWEPPLRSGDVAAVLHIRPLGGLSEGPFRTDRVAIDLYALDLTEGTRLAEALVSNLTAGPHEVPQQSGHPDDEVLDALAVELVPTEVPYSSDQVVKVSTTLRVDTRAS